jgi:hypothetical protein
MGEDKKLEVSTIPRLPRSSLAGRGFLPFPRIGMLTGAKMMRHAGHFAEWRDLVSPKKKAKYGK